jgi:hypothetical protein
MDDFYVFARKSRFEHFLKELGETEDSIETAKPSNQNRLGVMYYEKVYSYESPNKDILNDENLSDFIGTYGNVSGDAFYFEDAVKWFEKAARRGDANAMFNLGICYLEGNGDDCPYEDETCTWRASWWFQKARDLGHKDAKKILKTPAMAGDDVPAECPPDGKRIRRYSY